MFAILLSDKMDPFYQNVTSFPTVFFTFFLLLMVLYWLIAVLGFVEIDALDIDADSDLGNPNALAGIVHRFGLNGVPVTLIISLIALFGWMISYYVVHFIFPFIPDGLYQYLAGIPILIGGLFIAIVTTALVIKPLRPFFLEDSQNHSKSIIGQVAVVRSSRVDQSYGEATLDDGGAGLLLKVRTFDDAVFKMKDRVVLLEYLKAEHAYRVISEKEFLEK